MKRFQIHVIKGVAFLHEISCQRLPEPNMFVGSTLHHSGVFSPCRFVNHSPVMRLAMRACFVLVALLRALCDSCHSVASTGSFIRGDIIGQTLARLLARYLVCSTQFRVRNFLKLHVCRVETSNETIACSPSWSNSLGWACMLRTARLPCPAVCSNIVQHPSPTFSSSRTRPPNCKHV